MKLSKANIIRLSLCVLGLILLIIGKSAENLVLLIAAGIAWLAAVILWIVWGKCPHCGKYIGKYLNAHCPHCGKKIK